MNRIFGAQKQKTPKPSLNDAITNTDSRISAVDEKIKKLDRELTTYRDRMSKMRDGPGKNALKQRAMKVLQQRKMYEGQRDQLQSSSWSMEQAAMTTENLRNVMTTVDAMKSANKEMRRQYGKVDINKIERLQDEMEDLVAMSNELGESIGRSYEVPDFDDEELEAELEALGDELAMEEELKEEEGTVPSYLEGVTAPDGPIVEKPEGVKDGKLGETAS